jgi:gluconokinase
MHRPPCLPPTVVAAALADARRAWPDAERVRLHCITTNQTGFAFWTRMGFATTREVKAYPVEGMSAYRMERLVLPSPAAASEAAGLEEKQPTQPAAPQAKRRVVPVPVATAASAADAAPAAAAEVSPPTAAAPAPAAEGACRDPLPRATVVCGVMGAGKSTVGAALAKSLGRAFLDADDYHPPANIAKMERGHPLTDEDRAPWLRALNQELARRVAAPGPGTVLACSALKEQYRRALRGSLGSSVGFVLLRIEAGLVTDRATDRHKGGGHFMQPELVQSQLDTLEPLAASDRPCLACDISAEAAPDDIVGSILEQWPMGMMVPRG